MAGNPQSQHRCVFVGNIPYDATEEQLVQICEEVGPVVSFRLVIDRDTGKPKGYGFCEYKDEETALSARRNLQGYEINGRQLRVDFAENDKNADRSREQGRGGPGVPSNADASKQLGGPSVTGHPSHHQPIGDSVAMAAATVMAEALGSAQTATTLNQIGFQSRPLLGTDPLTLHLAKLSRSQLIEVMCALKAMATHNIEQARQLLLAVPNLPKALFQAQIMLGMVSPQMLQMPNIRQASTQPVQHLVQSAQTLPGLPPLPQNKMQPGLLPPYSQENRMLTGVPNQFAAIQQFPTQPQIQRPQLVQNQVLQPMPQNTGAHPSLLINPQFSAAGFQPSSSTTPAMPLNMDLKGRASSVIGQARVVNDSIDQLNRPSKLVKLNGGQAIPSSQSLNIATPMSTSFPTFNVPGRQVPKSEENRNPEKQPTQIELPTDVDSTLLQQVLSLTPEQLRSLPPDQQQQVIQLQQMLRQAT
ncbi:cleavage stimulating factor 64 [Phtheirospermum japonicum]|uniref:Cleavage stimulating factor 64 n=1 Tax=Phtheirospermum japonicum TaxID=374723 RepID=A0A830CLI8_9LAMI|nr:cleavage stimulating factor 64 [Phtheirospermum japonicum]